MQKRTVRTLLFSSALLALTLPTGLWAEDSVTEKPKIQVSMRDGIAYVTSVMPDPPLAVADVSVAAPTQNLDDRMPADIQVLVHKIASTHGVDPRLVAAVMKVESNYNPMARSPKGALGLMQLIPSTGQRFGVSRFFDPAENIEGGVKYLRFLSEKFDSNVELVLAAYNAGENLVARIGNKVPSIPETRDYVRKIQKIYKPSSAPVLVSASDNVKPVVEAVAPEPAPTKIYRSVDDRGVIHFSNIGPPR